MRRSERGEVGESRAEEVLLKPRVGNLRIPPTSRSSASLSLWSSFHPSSFRSPFCLIKRYCDSFLLPSSGYQTLVVSSFLTSPVQYGEVLSCPAFALFCLKKAVVNDDDISIQASESRLYSFSPETKEHLRKFRLGTSRAKDPQAIICRIHPRSPKIHTYLNAAHAISQSTQGTGFLI